ncbi:hypothetical protein D7V97_08025 [Corallococcus sp. CA053C]|nr:hypothetical protein D7V97_08025 [Corallococcus sp. CA053C]
MAEATSSTEGSWSALFSEKRGERAETPELLKALTPLALKRANAPSQHLVTLANILSAQVVLNGAAAARTAGRELAPLCKPALQQQQSNFQKRDAPDVAIHVLSFVNAAEVCGLVEGQLKASPALTWLKALAKKPQDQEDLLLYRCGWIALALGEPELAARLVGGGALPGSFTPGEQFGFNVQGFIRYLAAGLEQKASAADMRPAWQSYVEGFPLNMASQRASWMDLLWAGRVYYAGFEGLPVAEVGEAVHSRVKPAA